MSLYNQAKFFWSMYLSEVYACANRSYTQISITYLLVVIFYFLIVWIVLVFIFKYEGADRNLQTHFVHNAALCVKYD